MKEIIIISLAKGKAKKRSFAVGMDNWNELINHLANEINKLSVEVEHINIRYK